jgi:hypothetical protein
LVAPELPTFQLAKASFFSIASQRFDALNSMDPERGISEKIFQMPSSDGPWQAKDFDSHLLKRVPILQAQQHHPREQNVQTHIRYIWLCFRTLVVGASVLEALHRLAPRDIRHRKESTVVASSHLTAIWTVRRTTGDYKGDISAIVVTLQEPLGKRYK